jgi:hypothetical protein
MNERLREATQMEMRFVEEEDKRMAKMINDHRKSHPGDDLPMGIMIDVEMTHQRMHAIGYRPTKVGMRMVVDEDDMENSVSDDAWCKSRLAMHNVMNMLKEKTAGE